jgi:uncharacterized protein (TIGR02597 family)
MLPMKSSLRHFIALGVLIPSLAFGAEVFTTPVGAFKLSVAAGSGSGRALTGISFPLDTPSEADGQTVGRITSVSANGISNASAGWTAGQLSSAASPTLIRITSGAAKGRVFLISTSTANTESTLTIDASDLGATNLASLGIATGEQGDTYQLLKGQTIASLFGTDSESGILAGTNPNLCDQIQIMVAGAYRSYYLSNASTPLQWRRVGPNSASDNVVIKPDSGVVFGRLANAPLELTLLGTVPTIQRVVTVADGGSTALSLGWAADSTLANLRLTSLSSWTSGSVSIADSVQFLVAGAYRAYYHDGIDWRRVGPNTISNTTPIPAGTIYVIKQLGTATTSRPLTQIPPYSFP